MNEDAMMEMEYEDRTYVPDEGEQNAGWPGDGSGEDDFADYNQNEADDYRDE